jgi:hypothetical protein
MYALRFQSVRHSAPQNVRFFIRKVNAKKKRKEQHILFFVAAQKSFHYTEGHLLGPAFGHERTSHAAFN